MASGEPEFDGGLRNFFKLKAGRQDAVPRIERDGIHCGDQVRVTSLGRRHSRLFGVVKFVGVVHCESTFDVNAVTGSRMHFILTDENRCKRHMAWRGARTGVREKRRHDQRDPIL